MPKAGHGEPASPGPASPGPASPGPGADAGETRRSSPDTGAARAGQPGYAGLQVGAFLDALAAGSAAPAGGSAAALVLAQAAALCAKSARLSERQLTPQRAAVLAQDADHIRAEAASLIDQDARAYREVLIQGRSLPGDARSSRLAAALSDAADVPLRIVELAVPVAELAAALTAECNPALRGDAIAAGELAQAAARAAAALVMINLAGMPDDPRHASAGAMLAAISGLPRY